MKPNFADYPFTITGPTDAKNLESTGEWLACYLSGEEFDISINGETPIKFSQGLFLRWGDAQSVRVRITPKAGATVFPNSIVMRIGTGDFRDFRFNVVGSISISPGTVLQTMVASELYNSGADIALVAGTNTQIATSNPDRFGVDVWNDSATVTVRLGSYVADLADNRGLIVPPKTSRSLAVNGELYARAVGGAATISVNFIGI